VVLLESGKHGCRRRKPILGGFPFAGRRRTHSKEKERQAESRSNRASAEAEEAKVWNSSWPCARAFEAHGDDDEQEWRSQPEKYYRKTVVIDDDPDVPHLNTRLRAVAWPSEAHTIKQREDPCYR